jgi:galactose mutarotase-like enzyme
MTEEANELVAELDFGADPALLASFPFPHLLVVRIQLLDRTLSINIAVAATADKAVPLCYGFHPYLRLPDVPRARWNIETPPLRHLTVDDRGLPTGETAAQPGAVEPLGDRVFDDGYDQVTNGAVFAVSGGGRRIEVHFERGFPAAQIFAPPAEDVVCFEPMAAPTDALRRGGYRSARPGEPAVAQFSIRV